MNALAGEKIANTSPVAYFTVDGSGRSDVLCYEKLSQYETLCSEPCATRHFKLWDLPLKRDGSFYQVVKAYQKWQSFLLKAHLQVQYSGCTSGLLSIGTSFFFFDANHLRICHIQLLQWKKNCKWQAVNAPPRLLSLIKMGGLSR